MLYHAVDRDGTTACPPACVERDVYNQFSDCVQQSLDTLGSFVKIQKEILLVQMVGRIQEPVGVHIAHQIAVLCFQRVHISDELIHGPGFSEVGLFQHLDLRRRQVGAYRLRCWG